MRFTDQEKRERERREGGRDRKTKIERENNFLKINNNILFILSAVHKHEWHSKKQTDSDQCKGLILN